MWGLDYLSVRILSASSWRKFIFLIVLNSAEAMNLFFAKEYRRSDACPWAQKFMRMLIVFCPFLPLPQIQTSQREAARSLS